MQQVVHGWKVMSVKLAILKSGETIISDAKELIADDVICGYLLTDPHIVDTRKTMLLTEESQDSGNVEISLVPWIMLTSERKVPIAKDWIVTIVEPIDTVKKIYEDKVNGQDNQTDSSDEQTNLSE